jgi:formylglycine-generating enzyme required for sulfatase activity
MRIRHRQLAFLLVTLLHAASPCAQEIDVEAEHARGMQLREAHQDEAAAEVFRALWERTREPRALARLALAEGALGAWDRALEHMQQAIATRRDWWIRRNQRGLRENLAVIQQHVGMVNLRCDVPGAQLYVRGESRGIFPLPAPVVLPAGTVELETRAPGFINTTQSIDVVAGGTIQVLLTMAPVPPPPPVERPAIITCPAGRAVDPDTAGHCCWPQQAWSLTREACVGTPRCPADRSVSGSDCACRAGMAESPDTQDHCCWPGQVWSSTRSACVGAPTRCPSGMAPEGDACTALPTCPPGQELVARRCVARTTPGITGAPPTCPAGMQPIPAAVFLRGSVDDAGESNERPQRLVALSAYCIDRTEVTLDAFRRCVQSGRCVEPESEAPCNYHQGVAGDQPINCVSWEAANTFCAWQGRRLPTEAEWEFAARGIDAREYPWGPSPTGARLCWLRSSSSGTCAVGSSPQDVSPFGVLDLGGNLSEWVLDWLSDRYEAVAQVNPVGAERGNERVVRGGAWSNDEADTLRAPARRGLSPVRFRDSIGFRCAVSGR